ncbi:hypothetical protein ACFFJY_13035 [Fictibacillus aquaticus]|uniref:Uncharacterized protein n=1 Tax=Fictibacillus aquaticus TaxID=2021314 RepID=A0A235FDY4_9BACL|nr:hypothetical protein [Fictibacillus aquaticus]OYD59154.1 hypothetical protein CGZ90_04455 [Fictibacillus aquaticus]
MRSLFISAGVLSMMLGISFVGRMYGPQEEGLQEWGYAAVIWGIILFYAAMKQVHYVLLKILSGAGIILHGPPIILWIIFHGSTITDGPSAFHAHWAFSLPYLYIAAVCLFVIGMPPKMIKNSFKG